MVAGRHQVKHQRAAVDALALRGALAPQSVGSTSELMWHLHRASGLAGVALWCGLVALATTLHPGSAVVIEVESGVLPSFHRVQLTEAHTRSTLHMFATIHRSCNYHGPV